ncbi:DUF4097 family beta strand repeat-containing protein [Alicyclobacillus acidoterrestris]|uniref:Uncharacterized protein n=1 Tax=Alicyclobacillus acidoterrestris (strain ATCC 49025 / DSM 3922 / CIP 106132 / NCIMB 13137 / GD3B) TaxID=1356854 RepID=T0BR84_ALIAG|nr:hypothetical protein [Alicyclobacillus acidoterrestris]EPZ43289.1 hypothetical protein N007_13405 [Alicyclobacillus acidoterrestris ATCC 49025]UNO47707.1 hypothetical protein K1I37_13525 [Alicyclobacillus acidoterrestris]
MSRKLVILATSLVVIGAIGTALGAATGNLSHTPVSLGSIRGKVLVSSKIKHVVLQVPVANVTIHGTTGNTLTYSGELTALHQKTQNEANQLIRSEWKVENDGDTLKLILKQPHAQWQGLNASWKPAHLELNIPNRMTTDISTSNGGVSIQGMNADAKVQTSNSTIAASDIHGSLSLQTSNGKITAKRIIGSVTARDDNSAMEVASIHGSVDLQTSNASVRLNNISGTTTVMDSNGAIDATSSIQGKCYLKTSNAHISLSIPTNTSANIGAITSNASIGGDVNWQTSGSNQGHCILGDGLRQIQLQTTNGSISVYQVH